MSGLCETAVRASCLGRLREIRKGEGRNILSIFLTHFNYFIIHPPAQPFRRGYAHVHLLSTVFKRIFLAPQSEQPFFVRCEITLYQEPVYIFFREHI